MSLKRFSPVVLDWVDPKNVQRRIVPATPGATPFWQTCQWIKQWDASTSLWVVRWPVPKANITDRTISVGSGAIDHNSISTAGYRINASGQAEMRSMNTYTSLEKWLQAGSADMFVVRATPQGTSPVPQGFDVGSWIPATSSPEWWVTGSVNTPTRCTLLIEIAYIDSDSTLLDTAGNPILDTDGNPITIAGTAYTIADTANIGLRAGTS